MPVSSVRGLRGLFEAGIALGSELSLEALLKKLTEAAASLTGARYAALGVIDRSGAALEFFITHGVEAERGDDRRPPARARNPRPADPRGARPIRLDDLTEDPRAVGFPPGHPPMRSFLGVPILLREVAYGNLYLTEKEGAGRSARRTRS